MEIIIWNRFATAEKENRAVLLRMVTWLIYIYIIAPGTVQIIQCTQAVEYEKYPFPPHDTTFRILYCPLYPI